MAHDVAAQMCFLSYAEFGTSFRLEDIIQDCKPEQELPFVGPLGAILPLFSSDTFEPFENDRFILSVNKNLLSKYAELKEKHPHDWITPMGASVTYIPYAQLVMANRFEDVKYKGIKQHSV